MTVTFYVPVETADGLVLVPHTPEEYERLWAGVDREVCEAMQTEDS
jgi:hypothetical protein